MFTNSMTVSRKNGLLFVDDVCLEQVATRFGTPVYIYSWNQIADRFTVLKNALSELDYLICYSVKANSNLAILHRLTKLGAGFDIVSGGELERVLQVGGDPATIVFSGVGKSIEDIDFAIKAGIYCFNVESTSELLRIEDRARLLQKVAPISVRINPNVDAGTHPYISTGLNENKFGVPEQIAFELYKKAKTSSHLVIKGIDSHIGSQISDITAFGEALDHELKLASRLASEGIDINHLDLGGGLGIQYDTEVPINVTAYGELITQKLISSRLFQNQGINPKIIVEPGRYLVAESGFLVTKVEYLKPAPGPEFKNFAIVDAAMNDLLRPALYGAHHNVEPLFEESESSTENWNLVGPICESADFLALNRSLSLNEGDLLAIMTTGAYGFTLSSNYNSRPRPPEILIEGDQMLEIRSRESIDDLLRLEKLV